MPRRDQKPALAIGQIWQGKTKESTAMSRRRILAIQPDRIIWQSVGTGARVGSGWCTPSTFRAWARTLVRDAK